MSEPDVFEEIRKKYNALLDERDRLKHNLHTTHLINVQLILERDQAWEKLAKLLERKDQDANTGSDTSVGIDDRINADHSRDSHMVADKVMDSDGITHAPDEHKEWCLVDKTFGSVKCQCERRVGPKDRRQWRNTSPKHMRRLDPPDNDHRRSTNKSWLELPTERRQSERRQGREWGREWVRGEEWRIDYQAGTKACITRAHNRRRAERRAGK